MSDSAPSLFGTPAHEGGESDLAPFYERAGIRLFLGDCRDILPKFPPQSADLLITDPPYGLRIRTQRGSKHGLTILGDDDGAPELAAAAIRLAMTVLRPGRHAYVFGPPSLLPSEVSVLAELIWAKPSQAMADMRHPWQPQHERIWFFRNMNDDGDPDRFWAAKLRRGTVLHAPRPAAVRHPTEKPVVLLRELIESSSRLGEVVLDPFAGVGSTLVAAALEGRKAIGIELDRRYALVAAQRLERVLDVLDAVRRIERHAERDE